MHAPARFTVLNAQGLLTKFTNKLHYEEFQMIFGKNDFILITETWASSDSDFSVQGFNLIQLNRVEKKQNTRRNAGGIALYIRQSFYTYCSVIEKQSDDVIWIKLRGIYLIYHTICIYVYAILFRQIQVVKV
ncbi:MAG: hypothetical protein JAY75_11305 [Candidatus Thiodiazotropha taylori]|nr:hypothetical protein [Candidatus Thiodiazotropha taylori]MCW4308802.1 hypothetical protein [Candidatus Thiodiazotropha endolucinida]